MSGCSKIIQFFPERLRPDWEKCGLDIGEVQEIRLRVNQQVRVMLGEEITLPMKYGEKELEEIFRYLCHDSVYAYEEERRQGFIMVEGGHRIGITGELVATEQGSFLTKYIRYMNIRLAHEHKNIAENMIPYLYFPMEDIPVNTLIISPPGIGKTTLLRDTIRLFSNGVYGHRGCNVGVIDERGEIAGAYRGSAVLECGERTDVVTGGDKRQGISVLVRTFAPRVIAMDEIGGEGDAQALFFAGVSGCRILATVHGSSLEDIRRKHELSELLEQQMFQRFVLLEMEKDRSRSIQIFDGGGNLLCGKSLLRVSAS